MKRQKSNKHYGNGSIHCWYGILECRFRICHSMAHQLGAVYDTPHGIANAMLLPTVLEFNGEVCYERYQDILKALGYPAEKYTKEGNNQNFS